jgi:hypothetical protein
MHWLMDAVSGILLFTSRFNSPNRRRLLACAHDMRAVLICDACAAQLCMSGAQTRAKIVYLPSAALTTAATHSRAFPVAAAEICTETHS